MHHQPRRARCLRGTCTAADSRFASGLVLRAAHLFALGDGALLLVDVVTPMLTGYTLDELLWVIVVVDEVVEEDCK